MPENEKAINKKQMRKDEIDRVAVEGKFGQMKRRFGLDRIMTKLAESTMTVISLTILISNMVKLCQNSLFSSFFYLFSELATLFRLVCVNFEQDFSISETIEQKYF